MVDVFQDEIEDIMIDVARPLLSRDNAARAVLELLIGSTAVNEQLRTVLRDMANRELTVRVGGDTALKRLDSPRVLLVLGAAALWLDHRRRRRR